MSDTTFWWNLIAMFYGGALGDALGAPFKFRNGLSITQYNGRLEYRPKIASRYGVVGQVTDNSEMSIALARSIIKNGGTYNRNKAISAYIEWANSKPLAMSRNVRFLFYGINPENTNEFKTYESRVKKRFNPEKKGGIKSQDAQSNSSLMRCASLALSPGKNYKNVKDDVNLTNPNEINRECGVIYVKILRELLFGDLGVDPLETAKHPSIIEAIEQAKTKERRDVTKDKGWVVHAFYCAVYCLLHFEDYSPAIDWVIRLGGDTDTNAAIAGSLMGAKMGYILFVDPNTEPNLLSLLYANPDDGDFPRPEKYLPASYYEISEAFGIVNPEVVLFNENVQDLLFYYRRGGTPVLYNNVEENKYKAYFFLDDDTVGVATVISNEDSSYNVLGFKVLKYDTKRALIRIQKTPDDMDFLFVGESAPLFSGYRFLTRFAEALAKKAVDELHTEVMLTDPFNTQYTLLYNRDFFLINE